MKSIIVILPYFGKLPNMFPFWLESCKQNSTVDFLIATDQDLNVDASNIKVIRTSLIEVKQRIEKILEFDVWLEKPYKLCDFKPLYNQIFAEYVDSYDFWGYCDCDLIFGDIRSFVTEDILARYDYILGWGHFHIQKTHDVKYEQVWKTARGLWRDIHWREVFASHQNEWFDELPYGVSGRYYEMYPRKFWSGYNPKGKCFECPSSQFIPFIDEFNRYKLYASNPGYQDHIDRLPFLKRTSFEEGKHIIYLKEGINLYSVGINSDGKVVKKSILYAHFIHRKFEIRTRNTENYIICPNVFANLLRLNKMNIIWLANNPMFRIKHFAQRVISKLKRLVYGGK